MGTVGIVVNPLAGKDIRRLVGNASPVSDAAKVGMVRRAVVGAVEGGANRIVISDDHHHLGRRALDRVELPNGVDAEVMAEPLSGDRLDTVAAAAHLAKQDAGAVVVLGGDGTNRDVAAGWPEAPLVAVSTGTNNVFPSAMDATSAGTAAGLVASGAVDIAEVGRRAKRILIHVTGDDQRPEVHDVALVDVALVDGSFVGSRAVWKAAGIRHVVAAIASPVSSGLSSIAGRVHPVDRWSPEAVVIDLGPGGRTVRLPLLPGSFSTVGVSRHARLALDEPVEWRGPAVLALDGERTHVLRRFDRSTITVRQDGPLVIDVERTLAAAALAHQFDVVEEGSDAH